MEPSTRQNQNKQQSTLRAQSVSPDRKSPDVIFNRKIQDLTKRYGSAGLSGTKLLIKLTSAAILIQYHARRYLTSKQFYQAEDQLDGLGSTQSMRVQNRIPSLNLKKVSSVDKQDNLAVPGSMTSHRLLGGVSGREYDNSTSRSIRNLLDRNSYREYISNKGKILPAELTEKDFPKLLEFREAALTRNDWLCERSSEGGAQVARLWDFDRIRT